jgi:hypothetical protein
MAYRLTTAKGNTQMYYIEEVARMFQIILGGHVEYVEVQLIGD